MPTLATMRPSRRWGTRIFCGDGWLCGQFYPTSPTLPAKLAGTPIRKSAKDGTRAFCGCSRIHGEGTHFTPLLIERDPPRQASSHSVTGNGKDAHIAVTECGLLRSSARGSDAKHHLRAALQLD